MLKITLKSARVNVGLSQKEVAEKLNVSNKTISAWENGSSMPNVLHITALCGLYGVSYDDINFLPNSPLKAENEAG